MAITIDWGNTWIINVPKADLTLISGSLYELDTEAFRQTLLDLQDDSDGIVFQDTHRRNAPVTVAGTTYAQTFEILPPYSVQFEAGTYSVRLVGSNNNIFDVENGILVQNIVQVISNNAAGLIISDAVPATMSQADKDDIAFGNTGIVHLDTTGRGTAGTGAGVGLANKPSSNIADARIIANAQNVKEYHVRGAITLDQNYDGWVFMGETNRMADMVFLNGQSVSGAKFDTIMIRGDQGAGEIEAHGCTIRAVTNLAGFFRDDCIMWGSSTIRTGARVFIHDTVAVGDILEGGTDTKAILTIQGGDATIIASDVTGDWELRGGGANTTCIFGGLHGGIILDASNVAGEFVVEGLMTIDDNSTGTASVNKIELVEPDQLRLTTQMVAGDSEVTVDLGTVTVRNQDGSVLATFDITDAGRTRTRTS